MTTRAEIVAEARTWIGTPWHHQASRKGVGADCLGLFLGVARARGIPEAAAFDATPYARAYGREPDPEMAIRFLERFMRRVLEPGRAGDVLYLLVPGVAHPMHFALLAGPDRIIHSTVTVGRVVETRLDATTRARIVRCYGFRGIDG